MHRTRLARLEKTKAKRKRRYVVLAVAGAGIGLAAVGLGLVLALGEVPARDATEAPASMVSIEATTFDHSSQTTSVPNAPIEVPNVIGMPLDKAEMLLSVAGFVVSATATPSGDVAEGTVVSQDPAPGARVSPGGELMLVYAGAQTSATSASMNPLPVVCLDPGHQQKANSAGEPIGPGSAETKPKVTGGAVGAVTKLPEYELTLKVALLVRSRLEAQGVSVVMTRVTNNVDISNRQRAEVANAAKADLFVRIHADSNVNAALSGVSILYPSGNDWVVPIEAESLIGARAMQAAVLAATGATDRGIVKRADLSGFNWSSVPSVLVEMGFMSNPVEDELMATTAYQSKLADGITAGIMSYLER